MQDFWNFVPHNCMVLLYVQQVYSNQVTNFQNMEFTADTQSLKKNKSFENTQP